MPARILLLITVGLVPAAPEPADKEALWGTWRIVAHQENGKKLVEAANGLGTIVITADEIRIRYPREVAAINPYQIQPGKDPKHIDVLFPDAMKADARRLGIYSLEKDRLKICLNLTFDEDRPTKFTGEKGYEFFVLEREKAWW